MSRGSFRTELARRLEQILEPWTLPYKGAGAGELKAVDVYEQFVAVENDEAPDVPAVVVQIGEVAQDLDGNRVGLVTIVGLTYAKDSEQGIRDAENLIEAIETELISNPWLDSNRYKLIGPWRTAVSGNDFPIFSSTLNCSVEMPAVECLTGPDGWDIGDEVTVEVQVGPDESED